MSLSNFGTNNEAVREEWIWNKVLEIPAGQTILDAGCGDQSHKKYCKHLTYVSQDFGKYNGMGNSSGLQMGKYDYGNLDIVSDITSIPKSDESFDAILCTEVLEHIPDPIAVIKELSRLLKSNGILILSAPFCSLTHFAPYHFSTGLNRYWYEKYLPENRLKIIELTHNGNYFQYIAQELHRILSIASRYSIAAEMDESELNALNKILEMLSRYDTSNNDSWELLNFGYQIVAKKTK